MHGYPSDVLESLSLIRYAPAMPDTPQLRPATSDEIAKTLAFALRYRGRKRVFVADLTMARITADRLVQHLERSGFVLMKRPPAPAHSSGRMRPEVGRD
jgi:hypothetical protein